ncbi:MAG: HAD-IIA family hydrolase [Candidatus Heimdallarchaeota archaeon]|nr:HAD-IIA family hydrolase [Candidatus Heimdallarchaeota archaeon]MCK5408821.1 HAD-IIA family hydrolase [Candidatus Heimdallarchaeota archaeon]
MNTMDSQSNPFHRFNTFLFDGDGVIYTENNPLPGGIEFIELLQKRGKKVFILTNNSTKIRSEFKEKFSAFGLDLPVECILSSAYLTAHYISKEKPSARVYVVGEEGLKKELESLGVEIVNRNEEMNEDDIFALNLENIDYVVTGMDRRLNYVKISRAVNLLMSNKETKFIATNADFTFPTVHGLIPGGGAMIKILEELSGRKVEKIIGKPNSGMFEIAMELSQTNKEQMIMFGDRLETDILGANLAGIKTCLVLSGVTSMKDLVDLKDDNSPDLIMNSLQDAYDSFL